MFLCGGQPILHRGQAIKKEAATTSRFFNEVFKDEEPALNSVAFVDSKCISRCCIGIGPFSAILLFFDFSCGEATGLAN